MPISNFVLISFGSNLGDRAGIIKKAAEIIISKGIVKNTVLSSFYETEPVGYSPQPWFINSAMKGYSSLDEHTLISKLKEIETFLGRATREKWHEREIDIDLLIYGASIIDDSLLTIPHPRMHERRFVLIPAAEIAGDFHHPVFGISINEMLNKCKDQSVVKFKKAS